MSLRKQLVRALVEYRKQHNYTTYALRKIERLEKKKPIAGIGVTTLNKIEKDQMFAPSRKVAIDLLLFFQIDFILDELGNPQINKNEESSKSR